jgi:hypothetical protein
MYERTEAVRSGLSVAFDSGGNLSFATINFRIAGTSCFVNYDVPEAQSVSSSVSSNTSSIFCKLLYFVTTFQAAIFPSANEWLVRLPSSVMEPKRLGSWSKE